eukprot:6350756-Prymnesium_polylepis.2
MLSIPIVYGIKVPNEWTWVNIFSWVHLDVFYDLYHSQCIGGVKIQLNVTALGPLAVVVGMLVFGALYTAAVNALGVARATRGEILSGEKLLTAG